MVLPFVGGRFGRMIREVVQVVMPMLGRPARNSNWSERAVGEKNSIY